jgi:hypothetical protein
VSGITIHQRVHLWLWHWRDGPGWVRNPQSDELRALRVAGARVLRVQLQDDGPVPRELVDGWKAAGWKVWGAMRPSHAPLGGTVWDPTVAAAWAEREKYQLALHGLDFNFEREVRDADVASGGQWSRDFVERFRSLCPTLPCALDTYYGDFAGGINNVYTPGIRFNVQTYWGSEGIWDDPPTNIVKWCSGAQPVIPKAVIKPVFRVTRNNSGERLDMNVALDDAKIAGTKGMVLYTLDGGDLDFQIEFVKRAIAEGVAY